MAKKWRDIEDNQADFAAFMDTRKA